jgi:hypothetical protein
MFTVGWRAGPRGLVVPRLVVSLGTTRGGRYDVAVVVNKRDIVMVF